MRRALWETSAGALAALLNSRVPLVMSDLYTITLASGTVVRWTSGDAAITANGQLYTLGPGITRSRVRFVTGMQVDSLTITLATDPARPALIGSTPLLQYIRQGGFAGARVQLDRAFAPHGATAPTGALLWFPGRVADVQINRYDATVQVKSDLELLNVMVPRDIYQAGCLNTLYDPACGVSRASFQASGTATSTTDATRTTFSHGLAQAAGYFDLGTVKFITGANAGVSRSIKRHNSGQFVVLQPLPAAVASGDTFQAWPGCDKQGATCSAKFANLVRFRGQPFIPMPETVT